MKLYEKSFKKHIETEMYNEDYQKRFFSLTILVVLCINASEMLPFTFRFGSCVGNENEHWWVVILVLQIGFQQV
jgi:hypothetical protein